MKFLEFLHQYPVYLDGGMGTLLQERGLLPGEAPERWNLSYPEVIRQIHQSYFEAGSNVVNTNTFGANLLHFSRDELERIIHAAVENAKIARDRCTMPGERFVALDIGPTGKLLRPYGDLDFEEAVEIFAETVRIGAACGVDLVMIETMNDSYETKAALLAVKESCDLPVLVSNAYGADGKLLTGATPAAMVAMLEGMGADAIGANCSLGPKQLRGVAEELLRVASVPVLLKPNAGLPREEGGKTVYDVSPEDFAEEVADLMRQGVRMAGGCCGTTPTFIRALTRVTRGLIPGHVQDKACTVVSSYTHEVTFASSPLLIGERINPTGKKRFRQALVEKDMDYILNEGLRQQERGVHILDVNVGLPEIDEVELLQNAVCELQTVIDLPLQIDTADPVAMEAALRRYNGKALVNSVNGKEESMRAVFPLVKKYGGVVIALTLDENGIPDTVEGRVDIAKRILATAAEYGIDKKDLVFDTLAMTVSADGSAPGVTLGALRRIREELGCHTSLGVSNVSFGLPHREAVNSTFFAMALENGLSAAIMNPHSEDMMKTYYAHRALRGMDQNCADYMRAALEWGTASVATYSPVVAGDAAGQSASALQRAIGKGLKEQARELTRQLLQSVPPLDIVQNEIVPALDTVGKGFEEKTVYLPQLLMSAEAAKGAFEEIKVAMVSEGTQSANKGRIVIATVKGDIHDIGKNIVKLLLENYGFEVTDLGKDVAPGQILEATLRLNAPLVGLSALMTTTVPAMEETVSLLHEKAPFCKVLVGGAVLTREYASEIGADGYAKDAMEAVRLAEGLLQK